MEYELTVCLLLLTGWLTLLYGGWAIAQGVLKARQWLTLKRVGEKDDTCN